MINGHARAITPPWQTNVHDASDVMRGDVRRKDESRATTFELCAVIKLLKVLTFRALNRASCSDATASENKSFLPTRRVELCFYKSSIV